MESVHAFRSILVCFQSVPVCPSSRAGLLAGSKRSGIGGLPHVARVSHENIRNCVYTAQGILERIDAYALNGKQEQLKFWEDLDTSRRAKGLRCPDFLLSDFNITEDAIDRAPAHLDDVNTIKALMNLHQCLGLKDAW